MTTPPQPPSDTPTPRTDAIHNKHELHCTTEEVDELYVLSAELEKELHESKHKTAEWAGIAGSFAGDSHNLTTELALLKRANGEMRVVLELHECVQICITIPEWQAMRDKALSSTPATQPSPSIPSSNE